MKNRIMFLLMCLLCSICIKAQSYSDADKEIFNKYLLTVSKQKSTPELMVETAKFFLQTPYVGATLEKEPEQLVINLRQLDCMTLVETTTALVRTLRDSISDFKSFCANLKDARYRNGEINDYTDRLHYTSDWVYENQKKHTVKDVTREIGGEIFPVNVYFMSSNHNLYKQLKENPERVKKIKEKEDEINGRIYYYIPKNKITKLEKNIKNGDIIGFTTLNKGLDITHVGIAYWSGDMLTFIHASSDRKEVIVNPESLQNYINGIKNNNGIVVIRPMF